MKEGDEEERRNIGSFGFPYDGGQWHWCNACKGQRNGEGESDELQRRRRRRKRMVLELDTGGGNAWGDVLDGRGDK